MCRHDEPVRGERAQRIVDRLNGIGIADESLRPDARGLESPETPVEAQLGRAPRDGVVREASGAGVC
jgi:hypothetical protein